jgi:hypothetical protein
MRIAHSLRRHRVSTAGRFLVAAACLLEASPPALGWGSTGHRMISKLAIERLPDDVPDFLRAAGVSDDMGELGREPDRLRGAGKSQDADHDRGHFLDLDDEGTALASQSTRCRRAGRHSMPPCRPRVRISTRPVFFRTKSATDGSVCRRISPIGASRAPASSAPPPPKTARGSPRIGIGARC